MIMPSDFSIRRVLLALGVVVAVALAGFAYLSWSVTTISREASTAPGGRGQPLLLLVVSRTTIPMAAGARQITVTFSVGRTVTLDLVCFSEDKCRIAIIANPKEKRGSKIAGVAQETKAIAACNGGYFVPKDMTPAGLEVAQGVTTGKLVPAGQDAAAFGIQNDKPFISLDKDVQLSSEITGLVQCGPLLMDKDWTFKRGGSPTAARTFVMTDGKGQWAIGIADHLTLVELATVLAMPGLLEDFQVRQAMNLDGGPSTGLWWQDKDGKSHDQPEHWHVRNMLVVIPR